MPDQDLPARLRALADLHRDGILTDEEFERSKARLIDGIDTQSIPENATAPEESQATPASEPDDESDVEPEAETPAEEAEEVTAEAPPRKPQCAAMACTADVAPGQPWCASHGQQQSSGSSSGKKWIIAAVSVFAAIMVLGAIGSAVDSGSSSSSSDLSSSFASSSSDDDPDLYVSEEDLEESIRDDAAYQLTGSEMQVEDADCTLLDDKGAKWECDIRQLGEDEPTTYPVEVNEDGDWATGTPTDVQEQLDYAECLADAATTVEECEAA